MPPSTVGVLNGCLRAHRGEPFNHSHDARGHHQLLLRSGLPQLHTMGSDDNVLLHIYEAVCSPSPLIAGAACAPHDTKMLSWPLAASVSSYT